MNLPFTRDQFLNVFASFNEMLWPFAVALWILSLIALVIFVRRPRRGSLFINIVLVAHWLWSGIAYHFVFFSTINPAAWLFGGMFVIQAVLLIHYGVRTNQLRYSSEKSLRQMLAATLIAYALIYPAINLLLGHAFPRMPGFGVPCPTTIFTIGFLLAADRPLPAWLMAIPIVWSVIGGSAAFLLGVSADLMLLAAALCLWFYEISLRRSKDASTSGARA